MRLGSKPKESKAKLQSVAQQDWEKAPKRPVVNRSLARLAEGKEASEIMKDTYIALVHSR